MKKSKIIVPALALIAFSMAASITGSVAWFTANRTATINAGTYVVVKTSANLEFTLTGGIGTEVDTNSDNTILTQTTPSSGPAVGNKLTDGSFDHVGEMIYTPNAAVTSASGTALSAATASNMERATLGDGGKVYTAMTFDVAFKVKFASQANNVALFLNVHDCAFTAVSDPASGQASSSNDSSKGFRMAFIGTTSDANSTVTKRVYAPLQASANCTYVNSTYATTLSGTAGTYTAPALIDSAYHTSEHTASTLPEDNASNQSAVEARADYLGTFAFAENTEKTLSYKVVVWFEGTDSNVVNDTVLKAVTSVLNFKAINLSL